MEDLVDRWQKGTDQLRTGGNARHYQSSGADRRHDYFDLQMWGAVLNVEENHEHLERAARVYAAVVPRSNAADHDSHVIVSAYNQLLGVVRTFRTLESFLRLRAIYHSTERCARTHNLLCVLGYLTKNYLRQRVLQAGAPSSPWAALKSIEPLRWVTWPGYTSSLHESSGLVSVAA